MSRSARRGFTFTEFLVVVAIIAILIGLMLPSVRRVSVAAERMKCHNNMKHLILGIQNYEDSSPLSTYFPQRFPTGCVGPGELPEERLSWMVAILPYVEQGTLYQQFHLEKDYEGNPGAAQTRVSTYLCIKSKKPESSSGAVSNYVALAGLGQDAAKQPINTPGNGFMGYDRLTTRAMIKDGAANTLIVMETHSNLGPWARGGASTLRGFDPTDIPWGGENRPFGGGHRGGTVVAMADGSVRFLSDSVDPRILSAAITIAGGELEKLD